jgi:O-succinylbenzoic acid--CoA ligase
VAPHAVDSPAPAISGHQEDLPDGLALAVSTSGTTGEPKLAMLSGSALRASADATHQRLGGQGRWLLALPAHHIAGIQVLVRSLVAGTKPVAMELGGGFTSAAFARAAQEAGLVATSTPAYTALVPTQLVRLMASAQGREALLHLDGVLLGGAPAPARLLAAAHALGVRVVTTYGMSETAGGCVYDGRALDVSQVRLEEDGRIQLGGATVADGYLGEPELTAQSFSREREELEDTAWFRTDDVGHFDDLALVVDGRIDDLINTAGLKVAPGVVEAALLQLEGIAEAVVVGTPDAEWGEVVSAAVVLTHGHSAPVAGDLRARLRGILPDHALPRRVAALSELPLRGPGKPDRAAIRRLFTSDGP